MTDCTCACVCVVRGRDVILRRYLHVSSLCGFHSRVHQTLPTSHSVEEELSRCQARVEAVGYEAFSSRKLFKEETLKRRS